MVNTKDIILKLKEVREEKGLSYADILDLMEKNGDYLSKSTLSRIFADGSDYELVLKMACFGFRKGELLAITADSVKGDAVLIDKAIAVTEDGSYQTKTTKTESGVRTVVIGKELAEAIKKRGCVYEGFPGNILRYLHKAQDAVGVPRFKLHSFRHYYVSMCHAMGIPDVYIIKSIGHRSDTTLKRVYRHELKEETLKVQGDVERKISEMF